MKINRKFLAVAVLMFAAGWLEAGGPRTACGGPFPSRACGYPVGYYAVYPFVYTSWSPVLVYANTGFSNISTVASADPVVDRVPPPVFSLPSVTSSEAFGWKH